MADIWALATVLGYTPNSYAKYDQNSQKLTVNVSDADRLVGDIASKIIPQRRLHDYTEAAAEYENISGREDDLVMCDDEIVKPLLNMTNTEAERKELLEKLKNDAQYKEYISTQKVKKGEF